MAGKTIIHGLLAVALLAGSGAAAEVQRFHLSQAVVQLPDVKAYADILDDAGSAIPDAQATHPSATLGGRALKVSSLIPFEKTGEGVAYVFVVDTSESIGPARFDSIRSAIETWVQSAGPKDRVAIIEFSEKVHVLSDFNDGKEKTLAAAHTLTRAGKRSLIHQALVDAVELSSRRDADLPTRRVVVVVTDGKDEGSGLKSDDVLEQALAVHVPIYAIGYSNLPPAERRQYLDELHRIAEKSGGDYSEVDEKGLTGAFVGMKNAIRRVFVAAFTCADCPADSKKYRLEMQLEAGARAFSDGFDVLVVPAPAPAAIATVKPPWWKRPWWVYAGAGLVLVVLVLGLWTWRRSIKRAKAKRAAEMALPALSDLGGALAAGFDVPTYRSGKTDGPMPAGPSILVRFTVVRGRRRGTVSELRMKPHAGGSMSADGSEGRLVIGRKPACDLALAEDETVSSEHCELLWVNRKLVVRDLHSSNGTLVNGIPIIGDQPLENGDRIAIGQTEYRVGVVSGSL
jgi:VWFA-related protein